MNRIQKTTIFIFLVLVQVSGLKAMDPGEDLENQGFRETTRRSSSPIEEIKNWVLAKRDQFLKPKPEQERISLGLRNLNKPNEFLNVGKKTELTFRNEKVQLLNNKQFNEILKTEYSDSNPLSYKAETGHKLNFYRDSLERNRKKPFAQANLETLSYVLNNISKVPELTGLGERSLQKSFILSLANPDVRTNDEITEILNYYKAKIEAANK